MTFDMTEVIGLTAASLTTLSFLPQVWHMWKTKDVSGLSLTMYMIFFIGIVLWLIYGWLIESLAVVMANVITGLLVLLILIMKIKYRN